MKARGLKKKYPVDLNQGLANRLRAVSKYHTVSTLRGTLSGQIIMGGRPPPKKKKKNELLQVLDSKQATPD